MWGYGGQDDKLQSEPPEADFSQLPTASHPQSKHKRPKGLTIYNSEFLFLFRFSFLSCFLLFIYLFFNEKLVNSVI